MDSQETCKAAIYHFTDKSEKRPGIYLKELQRLRDFASSLGYAGCDEYVDMTLTLQDQVKKKELLSSITDYRSLILRDFYHLRKNTGACMEGLVWLSRSGIQVHSIEDGSFLFMEAPFSNPLRAAVYYCGLGIVGHSSELQFDIMEMFIRAKTNWTLVDSYADLSGNKIDGSQVEMQKLIQNRDKYDIILVQSFNDIHWRTAKFCKVRNRLQKDIYSMHNEIYLKYEREVDYGK